MTEDTMAEQRLLQVFLSRGGHGVYEVSITWDDHHLVCTCPGFTHRKKCKHVAFVQAKIGPAGEYQVIVPQVFTVEQMQAARATADSWRTFITHYVTPEVL